MRRRLTQCRRAVRANRLLERNKNQMGSFAKDLKVRRKEDNMPATLLGGQQEPMASQVNGSLLVL